MAKVCGCVHIGARTAEGGINYGAKGGGQAWWVGAFRWNGMENNSSFHVGG